MNNGLKGIINRDGQDVQDRERRIEDLRFQILYFLILYILSIPVNYSYGREPAVAVSGGVLSSERASFEERVGRDEAKRDACECARVGRSAQAAAQEAQGRALVAEAQEVFRAREVERALVTPEFVVAEFEVRGRVALRFEPRVYHPCEVAARVRAVASPRGEGARVEGELALGAEAQVKLVVFEARALVPAVSFERVAPVHDGRAHRRVRL